MAAKITPEVGDRGASRRWLIQWVLNPTIYHPRTRMPITHLDVTAVMTSLQLEHGINAASLAALRGVSRSTVYRKADAGRRMRQKSLKGGEDEMPVTFEEVYTAVREGVRDGILDAQGDVILREEGHPAEEAERILSDDHDD